MMLFNKASLKNHRITHVNIFVCVFVHAEEGGMEGEGGRKRENGNRAAKLSSKE